MLRHFAGGMACEIADFIFIHPGFIKSCDSVESKFVGRMIGYAAGFSVFPDVQVYLIGGNGKLGTAAPVKNVFVIPIDFTQLFKDRNGFIR